MRDWKLAKAWLLRSINDGKRVAQSSRFRTLRFFIRTNRRLFERRKSALPSRNQGEW